MTTLEERIQSGKSLLESGVITQEQFDAQFGVLQDKYAEDDGVDNSVDKTQDGVYTGMDDDHVF